MYPSADGHPDDTALVLETIRGLCVKNKRRKEAVGKLDDDLTSNAHRIDEAEYRRRGICIGSGPMESIHRIGSQLRLKLPGARWTERSSEAIFNLRMMDIVGNTQRFWEQPDIDHQLGRAFAM